MRSPRVHCIRSLTTFILMDYPKHIDTITMDYSIIYFKGVIVKMSKKVVLILANSADSGKMPPRDIILHLGLPCLPMYLFTGIKNEYCVIGELVRSEIVDSKTLRLLIFKEIRNCLLKE